MPHFFPIRRHEPAPGFIAPDEISASSRPYSYRRGISGRRPPKGGLLLADLSPKILVLSSKRGFCHVEEYAMKPTTVLFVALAATAFAGPAHAVFKCTTAKGVV